MDRPLSILPIAGIDDPAQARVLLYQAGRPVHAPLDKVGLLTPDAIGDFLTEAEAASTYLTTAAAATTYHPVSELTDWVAYTPTFTGFGTASAVSFRSQRIGDTLYVRGKFTCGTSTAVEARITLGYNGTNANVTSDAVKVPSIVLAGMWAASLASANQVYVLIESNVGYLTFGVQSASAAALTKQNGSSILGSTNSTSIFAAIPISGW